MKLVSYTTSFRTILHAICVPTRLPNRNSSQVEVKLRGSPLCKLLLPYRKMLLFRVPSAISRETFFRRRLTYARLSAKMPLREEESASSAALSSTTFLNERFRWVWGFCSMADMGWLLALTASALLPCCDDALMGGCDAVVVAEFQNCFFKGVIP